MNTAHIVRTARERNGFTERQLAAKAGVSLQTIINIEQGAVSPKMDTMLQIMNALDYDIVFNPRYKGGYYGNE